MILVFIHLSFSALNTSSNYKNKICKTQTYLVLLIHIFWVLIPASDADVLMITENAVLRAITKSVCFNFALRNKLTENLFATFFEAFV